MRKYTLLVIIYCLISFTASAQFWPLKRHARYPQLAVAPAKAGVTYNTAIDIAPRNVRKIQLPPSRYSDDIEQQLVMTEAKHNMRFHIYNKASYNFSALAALYLRQNRFSEAKWYLLQSNTIARQAEDHRHLIDNLMVLADIKTTLGELPMAIADLQEAHTVAMDQGMRKDMLNLEKKIFNLQNNKLVATKVELRYAEAVEVNNSKPTVKPAL